MTSENDRSHGSLFLRFGVLAFGLGTLIYVGLEFLSFFEVPRTCMERAILLGANPVIYMVFVFMQMYYIFVHSRININKNKVAQKNKFFSYNDLRWFKIFEGQSICKSIFLFSFSILKYFRIECKIV